MFFGFKFCSAGADNVKTARISVCVDDFVGQFDVFSVDNPRRAAQKAIEFVLGVSLLQSVINTGNNVVSAGSLTSGEDYADVFLFKIIFVVRLFKSNHRFSVGVGEKSFDFVLVCNRFCAVSFDNVQFCNS